MRRFSYFFEPQRSQFARHRTTLEPSNHLGYQQNSEYLSEYHQSISLYSVRMRKIRTKKNLNTDTFQAVIASFNSP